ncbi:raptor N-terminal caspase like domain-containing protein [Limtongia smithiae]|uniref:raptor N-terminal caspase like domain-containing protein n=1 Tax=Limtongia smithiae TaxID=1125753 RepID=UPI0034CFED23
MAESLPSTHSMNGMLTPHGYVINGESPENGAHNGIVLDGQNTPAKMRSQSSIVLLDGFGDIEPDDPDNAAYKYHERTAFRHGFENVYNSEKFMSYLSQNYYIYFDDQRHDTAGNPKPHAEADDTVPEWRIRDRQKTVLAALVLCLNIGVDPPDVFKPEPCARLEAWVDPTKELSDSKKVLETIGSRLQAQYENLSNRTKYTLNLDPNEEDAKKTWVGLRRRANDERVLFHYNGHGVPKPTESGEIWVFNKSYTQYIPVSIRTLQSWLGAPCIFVYDCHAAGNIVTNFNRFVDQRIDEERRSRSDTNQTSRSTPAVMYKECMQLAACQGDELLPMNPDLPMDLFTCCLTSPIEIAIRWFILQSPLPNTPSYNDIKIPGKLNDRRTPLGELNWIFTAVTDTIAWSALDKTLFKKLFRQELMVAALFRNFLLAERIMRVFKCHPISQPALPDTHNHPLWECWDLALDQCIAQMPLLNASDEGGPHYEYKHSTFFEEQLTAFELWLKFGSKSKKPPEQLPIVLQVLLSQVHRVRALKLLGEFLDLGPWAVYLALSIGIFPYVLKLLQSPSHDLRESLVFIWARMMSVDHKSIQQELLKDSAYKYFTNVLHPDAKDVSLNDRARCAFILSLFCRGNEAAQRVCSEPVMQICVHHIVTSEEAPLRQWASLCISQLWDNNTAAKSVGALEDVPSKLAILLNDGVPEVRVAALVALSAFLEISEPENTASTGYNTDIEDREVQVVYSTLKLTGDGSIMVRKEIIVLFSRFVKHYASKFIDIALKQLEAEKTRKNSYSANEVQYLPPEFRHSTVYVGVWKALLAMSTDPFIEVAEMASKVVDYIFVILLNSPLKTVARHIMESSPRYMRSEMSLSDKNDSDTLSIRSQSSMLPLQRSQSPQPGSVFASTLRKSASIATSLRNFALGYNGVDASPVVSEINHPPNANDVSVSSIPYGSGIHGMTARFETRKLSDPLVLPLQSGFFQWSCEYFQEPQWEITEPEEPGSVNYNERVWRRMRNEKTIAYSQPQKNMAAKSPWHYQIGHLNNVTQPTKIVMAQFEPHLVAVDDRDGVTVWNWQENQKLMRFCNENPVGTKITEVKFLNEDDIPVLMTGAGDGVIRLYRNYESEEKLQLICAWRALTDMLPANRSSGLVADWQQGRGTMLVGGDVKVVRLWDAPREYCVSDIPARSGSPITSLTSDQVAGHIFVAGFGDGALRVYDRRIDPHNAMVKVWKYHKSWVLNVHMQRGGARELASGSVDGKVHLWDLRNDSPIVSFTAHERGMRAMHVHEHAPILATGSETVKIWRLNGESTATVRAVSSGGYISRGPQFVSAVSFHPHHMVMAVNNAHDAHMTLYNCSPMPIPDFS